MVKCHDSRYSQQLIPRSNWMTSEASYRCWTIITDQDVLHVALRTTHSDIFKVVEMYAELLPQVIESEYDGIVSTLSNETSDETALIYALDSEWVWMGLKSYLLLHGLDTSALTISAISEDSLDEETVVTIDIRTPTQEL